MNRLRAESEAPDARRRILRVVEECIEARNAEAHPILASALRACRDGLPLDAPTLHEFLAGPLRTALERSLGIEAGSDALAEIERILDAAMRGGALEGARLEPTLSGQREMAIGDRPTMPPRHARSTYSLLPWPERAPEDPRAARLRAARMDERRVISFDAERKKRRR
jgi:hypothetical protein